MVDTIRRVKKNPAAVALGSRGGKARARNLSAEEIRAISTKASKAAAVARSKKAAERKRQARLKP